MAKYELRYMFDFGSGVCLWSMNGAAKEKYDYAILPEELPVSQELRDFLTVVIAKYDTALNWDCPNDDLLWSGEETAAFRETAIEAYERICEELGAEYEIEFWNDFFMATKAAQNNI